MKVEMKNSFFQVKAAKAGIENLVIPDEAAVSKAYEVARHGGGGVNKTSATNGEGPSNWRIGELEWEAWMRVLDFAVRINLIFYL